MEESLSDSKGDFGESSCRVEIANRCDDQSLNVATGSARRMESSKEKRTSRTAKLMVQRANPNEPAMATTPKESPMDLDLASALAWVSVE